MHKFLSLAFLIAVSVFAISCGGGTVSPGTPAASPTEAYKALYAGVKAKNTDAIKERLTAKTHEFAQMVAQRNNTPIEKVFENGFTATTFADSLPEIRDERIEGNMGAVEVWNAKDNRWEDLAFINEEGGWKLAVGEQFAGSFKSPGKSRSFKEKEATNAVSNNTIEIKPQGNANVTPIIPKRTEAPMPANANAASNANTPNTK